MRFLLVMLMVAIPVAAQVVPPIPDIPNRPDVPLPPNVERIIERQTERRVEAVLSQVEQMSARLPEPAIQGMERAQQAMQRAANAEANQEAAVNNRQKTQTLFNQVEVEYGWKAVEREWVLLLSDDELIRLRHQLPEIMEYATEQTASAVLGVNMLKLKVPQELDSYSALGDKVNAAVAAVIDRNHLYQPESAALKSNIARGVLSAAVCQDEVRLGIIDSAIALTHTVFRQRQQQIISRQFLPAELDGTSTHGTAVASLLIGEAEGLRPLLPQATLYSAAVFYQLENQQQSGSLFSIIRALDWLNSEKVPVINMSLTGPDNQVLRQLVEKSQQNGSYIVAAVGNAGPAAAPLFPAAYPAVLAISAVDENATPYRWSVRGEHVDFAALGVNVNVADVSGGWTVQSGTSLAAPVASAHLVCVLHQSGYQYAEAINKLKQRAIDKGAPGHDVIFGYGILPGASKPAAQ